MKERKIKRKLKTFNFITIVFVVTMAIYMVTSIVLKSFNVSLATRTASTNKVITELKSEVDTINAQVKELSDYNRVVTVLSNDMNTIDTTVITVQY